MHQTSFFWQLWQHYQELLMLGGCRRSSTCRVALTNMRSLGFRVELSSRHPLTSGLSIIPGHHNQACSLTNRSAISKFLTLLMNLQSAICLHVTCRDYNKVRNIAVHLTLMLHGLCPPSGRICIVVTVERHPTSFRLREQVVASGDLTQNDQLSSKLLVA